MVEISTLSRQILRELCTNSRITITELAEKYNVSRHVVKERIMALEKEFGLRYTIEPNYAELGFATIHVLRLKLSRVPKIEEAKQIFAKSRIAQFVATTTGDFHLIVFAIAKNSMEYSQWETALSAEFAKFGLYMKQSEVTVMHLGFIPLDYMAIEASEIDPVYKKMLSTLNENSRISIRDLSKRMGSSEALTRYYFRELNKTKIIKRYTALATKPYFKSNILFFVNYTIKSGVEKRVDKERRTMYWKQLDEFPILNEFPLQLSTSGGDRSFTWACYNDYKQGLKQSVEMHRAAYKEDQPTMRIGMIKEVVKGYPPIRNVDMKDSFITVDWSSNVL